MLSCLNFGCLTAAIYANLVNLLDSGLRIRRSDLGELFSSVPFLLLRLLGVLCRILQLQNPGALIGSSPKQSHVRDRNAKRKSPISEVGWGLPGPDLRFLFSALGP